MNPLPIKTPSQRMLLEVRDKPYFIRITDELHLGYKRGKSISRWVVRRRIGKKYVSRTFRGVIPDDMRDADGRNVFSYDQALTKAATMNIESTTTYVRHCSFCNKPQHEVKVLIAGPSSYICGSCVDICNEIIENQRMIVTGSAT